MANLSNEELAEQSISLEDAKALGYDPEEEINKPDWLKREEVAEADQYLQSLDAMNNGE